MNGPAGLHVHWSVETEREFVEELAPILEHNTVVKIARALQLNCSIVTLILALVS